MKARTFALQIATMACISGIGVSAFAQSAQAQEVSLEVRSIHATKDGAGVDSRLSDIKSKLERGFGGYKGFKLLSTQTLVLKKGGAKTLTLPNKANMTLNFSGFAGNLANIGMQISDKVNSKVRLSKGSTFFQAGMRHQGGILITAIKLK